MRVGAAQTRQDVSPGLWLGLPLGSLALYLLAPLLGCARWRKLMAGELGFVELTTVAFLLPAAVLGVVLFVRRRALPARVGWVMLLAGLAALYFAGEEASWGQYLLGFSTPRLWAQINTQGECNLHNLALGEYGRWGRLAAHLLGHLPRQAMLAGVLVVGVAIPLGKVLAGRRGGRPVEDEPEPGFWYWVIPSWRLVPASLLAAGSTLPEKILRSLTDVEQMDSGSYAFMAFVDRAGEFKEYCFAMVILLYMLSARARLRSFRVRGRAVSVEAFPRRGTIDAGAEGLGDQRLAGMAAGSRYNTFPIRRHRS